MGKLWLTLVACTFLVAAATAAVSGCAEDRPPSTPDAQAPVHTADSRQARTGEQAPAHAAGVVQWRARQQPSGRRRIREVPAPGAAADPFRPRGSVLRFEVRPGDVTVTSGYRASRAEVYGRSPTPWSTPAERWPDPPGAERWYSFAFYLPEDFPVARDSSWLLLAQWKGYRGGSPPLAIEAKRDRLRLGGKLADLDLGALPRGRWTNVVVGMRLSPDPEAGWLTVQRDGREVVPRQRSATMEDYYDRREAARVADPVYLKQGIYRASGWDVTHVAFFGRTRVAATREALDTAQ